jgi:hypothetical protein
MDFVYAPLYHLRAGIPAPFRGGMKAGFLNIGARAYVPVPADGGPRGIMTLEQNGLRFGWSSAVRVGPGDVHFLQQRYEPGIGLY